MTTTTAIKIHPFERAGLGVAPFRCVGVERRVGPIKQLVTMNGVQVEVEIGAPGQPMGCCDYCHTGIADCFIIRSSDGKRFVVGCDCVAKTEKEFSDVALGFRKVKLEHDRAKRAEKTAARRERELAKLAERKVRVQALLEQNPTLLANQKHPSEYYAAQGRTQRDYVTFLLAGAGVSGQNHACYLVEKEVEAQIEEAR